MGQYASTCPSCTCCYMLPGGQRGPHYRVGSFLRVASCAGPRSDVYKRRPDLKPSEDQFYLMGFTWFWCAGCALWCLRAPASNPGGSVAPA